MLGELFGLPQPHAFVVKGRKPGRLSQLISVTCIFFNTAFNNPNR
jgi:hypothetical protein